MSKLPNSTLNKLNCTSCSECVTFGPVFILPDGRLLCKNCDATSKVLCPGYIEVAKNVVFPCKYWYNTCKSFLKWNQIDHENRCSYRPSGCLCCRHPCLCSSKKQPDDSGALPITANQDTLDQLTCPGCNGFINSAPIYITDSKKNVCYRCGEPNRYQRNIALEILLEPFVIKCSHRISGCEEYHQFGPSSRNHEAVCGYNKSRCQRNPPPLLIDPRELERQSNLHYQNSMRSERNYTPINNYRPQPARPHNQGGYPRPSENLQYRGQYQDDYERNYRERRNSPRPHNPRFSNRDSNTPIYSTLEDASNNHKSNMAPYSEPPRFKKTPLRSESIDSQPKEKKRGVINTGNGHVWGTITPNNIKIKQPKTNKKQESNYDDTHRPVPQKQEFFLKDLRQNLPSTNSDYASSDDGSWVSGQRQSIGRNEHLKNSYPADDKQVAGNNSNVPKYQQINPYAATVSEFKMRQKLKNI